MSALSPEKVPARGLGPLTILSRHGLFGGGFATSFGVYLAMALLTVGPGFVFR